MAWQDEVIPIVRVLINDAVPTYTYADSRLESIILAAAYMVVIDLDLKSTYAVSMSDETLEPDPTEANDVSFINLMALKAAFLVLSNEAKLAGKKAIQISDGPSSVSLGNRYTSAVEAAKDMDGKYAKTKLEYLAGNSKAGQAIMTPFTNENVPVQDNMR
jgi:hypothetical protein